MKEILIIDDDRQVLEGLTRLMMNEGFAVDCAEDSITAMNLSERKKYDLIIVDIILPKMDGLELAKQIKKIIPGIAIVVITGHPSEKFENTAKELGVRAYLKKPFSITELTEIVHNILN